MTVGIEIKFGDFDFSEDVEEMDVGMNSRLQFTEVKKRHGVLVTDAPVLDARAVNFRGTIMKTGENAVEEARERLTAMQQAFNAGRQRLQIYTDLYLNAFKRDFSYAPLPGSQFAAYAFTVGFVCDDPFFYSIASPTDTIFLSITSPPFDFVINNPGNAYCYPRIQFIADYGADLEAPLMLTNHLHPPTGDVDKTFQYNGVVAAGNILDADMGNFSVKNNDVKDLTNFSGKFLWLMAGDNDMTYSGSPVTLAITFQRRYV